MYIHALFVIYSVEPRALFLKSSVNFSGLESCSVCLVYSKGQSLDNNIFKIVQWNYQLNMKQNWLVCAQGTLLLFKKFRF